MAYKVMVDDNFHYMEDDERTTRDEYETLEAAIEACKKIVNDFLEHAYTPGATAEKLYEHYVAFGEDPWILGGEGVPFSAWTYAKLRCAEICAAG